MLLRQGIIITLPSQAERLVEKNAVRDYGRAVKTAANAPRAPSQEENPVEGAKNSPHKIHYLEEKQPVFELVGSLTLNLKHILTTAIKVPEQIDLPVRINKLAADLQSLCQADLDGALAAAHLDYFNPYLVVHQVMGAILTEIIAEHKGLSIEERLPFVCAALTRDIGQITLQSEIDRCNGPLPESLKAAMQEHPFKSKEILVHAGVTEAAWLDAVWQHHERLDGSGYPQKLSGDAVGLGARILMIADSYSAMTKPRPYRNKALHAQNVLREIYLEKDVRMDGELAQGLIKEIGMLPPGTIVRLKSGEVAAIKSRAMKADDATVFCLYNPKGMPIMSPIRRQTSNPEYEITGIVAFSECRSAAVTIKRLWLSEFNF